VDLLSLPTSRISKDIYNQGVRYEELDWISRHDCSNYFVSDRGCGEEKKSGSTDMSHSSETKARQLAGQLIHIERYVVVIGDENTAISIKNPAFCSMSLSPGQGSTW
jgi:hypothetical protein